MSELKEYDLVEIQDYRGEVYLKSEVDAVLAEKDAEIRRLKRELWLARAWSCGRSSEYFIGMASRCKIGQEDFYREVSEQRRINNERIYY